MNSPRVLSVRPPWGNAIARWGKDIENRTWVPPKIQMSRPLWIHQGKKWGQDERYAASELAALLEYKVPLAPEGYQHGIVATCRIDGIVDTRPADERPDYGDDGIEMVPDSAYSSDNWRSKTAVVVGARDIEHARQLADWAAVSQWWIGPVGWMLKDVVGLPAAVPCKGAQGLWIPSHQIQAQIQR